jgi:predicted DNA-binding transcriptional regulator AlpA
MTDWKAIVGKKTTKEAVLYLHHLYTTGATSEQLAERCGVTPVTILNAFRRYGLTVKQHGGLNKGKRKVSHIDEKDYCTLTYKEISKKYGISRMTIWRIIRGYPPRKEMMKDECSSRKTINYLEELKRFMASPEGEVVRKINKKILERRKENAYSNK